MTVFTIPKTVVVQPLDDVLLAKHEVIVRVMRLDLLDEIAAGNKLFKLAYHLQQIEQQQPSMVISCGGAYSNHIHALAYACYQRSIPSVGLLRWDKGAALTACMQDAQGWGMQLEYLTRSAYRRRHSRAFREHWLNRFSDAYFIAEGAADDLGFAGTQWLGEYLCRVLSQQHIVGDVLALPCGTAATLCGILSQLPQHWRVLGLPVLKPAYLQRQLSWGLEKIAQYGDRDHQLPEWELDTQSDYGGYAKVSEPLYAFAQRMWEQQQLPLDPVYSAKALYRVFELVEQGRFASGTQLLFLHTGGLQGCRGFSDWPVSYSVG